MPPEAFKSARKALRDQPVLDPRTRTARAEILVDNPDAVLRPGEAYEHFTLLEFSQT